MNNQEPKCPCIDCIIFPLCTSILKTKSHTISSVYILKSRCELIKDYLNSVKLSDDIIRFRYNETLKLFKIGRENNEKTRI